jgi:hypothetical protein
MPKLFTFAQLEKELLVKPAIWFAAVASRCLPEFPPPRTLSNSRVFYTHLAPERHAFPQGPLRAAWKQSELHQERFPDSCGTGIKRIRRINNVCPNAPNNKQVDLYFVSNQAVSLSNNFLGAGTQAEGFRRVPANCLKGRMKRRTAYFLSHARSTGRKSRKCLRVHACSRMTSMAFLSVRSPRKTGCRISDSLVHSENFTSPTSFGISHVVAASFLTF